MGKKLSVVIVTFNNQDTILKCLKSLKDNESECEIVIVDNDSSDNTCNVLTKSGYRIKLLRQEKNLGFGKACNIGVEGSVGEGVCLLNPDTYLTSKNGLTKAFNLLVSHKEFGLLGVKLLYPNGSGRRSVRNKPTIFNAFKEYVLGIKGSFDFFIPESDRLVEVDSVVGACIIIKRKLFREVGGFDEKYFMYYEDLDLCRKVRKCGYKIGYFPGVLVEHIEGVSGRRANTFAMLRDSSKIYHGFLGHYVIQIIIMIGRILGRV